MDSSLPCNFVAQISALSPNDDLVPKGYQWSDAIDPPLTLALRAQQDHRQLLVLRHVTAAAIDL